MPPFDPTQDPPYLTSDEGSLYPFSTPPFLPGARKPPYLPSPGVGSDLPPVPPPDAAATGVPPSPSPATAPPPGSSDQDIQDYKNKLATVSQIEQTRPPLPKPKWWQRLGAMGVGAAAGYANSSGKRMNPIDPTQAAANILTGPGYQRDETDYQRRLQVAQSNVDQAASVLKADQQQAVTGETQARAGYYKDLPQARRDVAQAQANERKEAADLKSRETITSQMLKGRDEIDYVPAGSPIPQGYSAIPDLTTIDPKTGQAKYVHVVTPATIQLQQQHMDSLGKYLPGRQVGDIVPYGEWKQAQGAAQKSLENQSKPQTAEQASAAYQAGLAKLDAEGLITPQDLNDNGKLLQAIHASKTLSPPERQNMVGYLGAKPTPASTGSNTTIRVEGMGEMRENRVLDTKNGNRPVLVSSNELNRAAKEEPGRYVDATQGANSLKQENLQEDIRGSINNVRDSLKKIPEFDLPTKTRIALTLGNVHSKGQAMQAAQNLLSGAAAGSLTPDQQDYVVNLANLLEVGMSMRSTLGAGQGSDDLRSAFAAAIPGPSTPSKAFAGKRLDALEQTIDRLSRGIPEVPLRPGGPPAPAGAGNVIHWTRDAQGNPVPQPAGQ